MRKVCCETLAKMYENLQSLGGGDSLRRWEVGHLRRKVCRDILAKFMKIGKL